LSAGRRQIDSANSAPLMRNFNIIPCCAADSGEGLYNGLSQSVFQPQPTSVKLAEEPSNVVIGLSLEVIRAGINGRSMLSDLIQHKQVKKFVDCSPT
jgi:hypothetical protein